MPYPSFLKGFVVGYSLNVSNAQIVANGTDIGSGVTTGLKMAGDGAVPFSSEQYQPGMRTIWLDTGFNGKGGVITDEILGRSNIFVRVTVVKTDAGNTDANVILRIHNDKNDPGSFIPINSGFVNMRPNVERPAVFGAFHGGAQALSVAINSDVAGTFRLNGVYIYISEMI